MTGTKDGNQAIVVIPGDCSDLYRALLECDFLARIFALLDGGYQVRLLCENSTNTKTENSVSIASHRLVVDQLPESAPPASTGPMSPAMNSCRRVYEYLRNTNELSIILGSNQHGLLYYAQCAKRQGLQFCDSVIEIILSEPYELAMETEGGFCESYRDTIEIWLQRTTLEMADRICSSSTTYSQWLKTSIPVATCPIPVESRAYLPGLPPPPIAAGNSTLELIFAGGLTRRNGLVHFIKALRSIEPEKCLFSVSFVDTPPVNPELRPLLDNFINSSPIECQTIELAPDSQSLIQLLRQKDTIAVTLPVLDTITPLLSLLLELGLPAITSVCKNTLRHKTDSLSNIIHTGKTTLHIASTLSKLALYPEVPAANDFPAVNSPVLAIEVNSVASYQYRVIPKSIPPAQVSVCISHYCRPGMLRVALESLRCQSIQGFEVIVVDDGSVDEFQKDLEKVCLDYAEYLNLRLIKTENQYLGACRNTGWQVATGQYILFMDDDNIALPNEIEVFCRASATSNSDILTCFSDTFPDNEDLGLSPTVVNRITPVGPCLAIGTIFNCFGDSNSFWRKSALENIGGFTELKGVGKDDNEIFARAVLMNHSLSVVPESLFYYRISKDRMRHHHLNPEAGTHRVLKAYRDSENDHLGDLANLVVGQHRLIERLQRELTARRELEKRTTTRLEIAQRLLKFTDKQRP